MRSFLAALGLPFTVLFALAAVCRCKVLEVLGRDLIEAASKIPYGLRTGPADSAPERPSFALERPLLRGLLLPCDDVKLRLMTSLCLPLRARNMSDRCDLLRPRCDVTVLVDTKLLSVLTGGGFFSDCFTERDGVRARDLSVEVDLIDTPVPGLRMLARELTRDAGRILCRLEALR